MPIITWNDSLSVKVSLIDMQHKQLVDMINELYDAILEGRHGDVISKTLLGLSSYAAYHFQTEEDYFNQFSYPDATFHASEHQFFARKLSEYKKQLEEGNIALSGDVLRFLCDWLRNHIQVSDRKFGPFFNERGLR